MKIEEMIAFIPEGKENRISRRNLAKATNLCDRRVRQHIQTARMMGYPICTDTKNGGYWLGTYDEIAETAEMLANYGKSSFVSRNELAKVGKHPDMEGMI